MSISVLPGFRVLQLPVTCDQVFLCFVQRKWGKKNEDHRLFHSGMSTYKLSVKFVHGCVPVVVSLIS